MGKVTWKMIKYGEFKGTMDGYEIDLWSGKPNIWHTYKDGVMVDSCLYHSPMNEEGNGKHFSEKYLNEYILKNG